MTYSEYNFYQILNTEPNIYTEDLYNEEFFITIDNILLEFDDIIEELNNN